MTVSLRLPGAGRLSPQFDPWDPWPIRKKHKKHQLTSVEFTVTHRCNMRCAHCAVGDTLTQADGQAIPLALVLERLAEVETLQTISITGGEPSFAGDLVDQWMIPLLDWTQKRGILSQMNSNLTMPLKRYEAFLDVLDVMHITYNYENAFDFWQIGFEKATHEVPLEAATKLFDQLCENAIHLSERGMFVSAESMINYRTHERIGHIHRQILELGVRRHEVHPMYPSDFASNLPKLTMDETRAAVHRLLDERDPNLWLLFGTLPFFACNDNAQDWSLIRRLASSPNVTVRNDPDGRNRLNVDIFTGDVYVTDFAAVPSLGNIFHDRLDEVFARWQQHSIQRLVDCACEVADCCGPNLIVRDMYYPTTDFQKRSAHLEACHLDNILADSYGTKR